VSSCDTCFAFAVYCLVLLVALLTLSSETGLIR